MERSDKRISAQDIEEEPDVRLVTDEEVVGKRCLVVDLSTRKKLQIPPILSALSDVLDFL